MVSRLLLVLIVVIGAGIAYCVTNLGALNSEASAYADGAIPAIVGGWDQSQLETRMSPELRSKTSTADMDRQFNFFRRLGSLKKYNGAKGTTTQSSSQITANFTGSADFDNGSAQIGLQLIKHGEQWQMSGFQVQIDARTFREQR